VEQSTVGITQTVCIKSTRLTGRTSVTLRNFIKHEHCIFDLQLIQTQMHSKTKRYRMYDNDSKKVN